jgi:hypothetical protein
MVTILTVIGLLISSFRATLSIGIFSLMLEKYYNQLITHHMFIEM